MGLETSWISGGYYQLVLLD